MPVYLRSDGFARKGASVLVPGRLRSDGLGYTFGRDTGAAPPISDSGTAVIVISLSSAQATVTSQIATYTISLDPSEALTDLGSASAQLTPSGAQTIVSLPWDVPIAGMAVGLVAGHSRRSGRGGVAVSITGRVRRSDRSEKLQGASRPRTGSQGRGRVGSEVEHRAAGPGRPGAPRAGAPVGAGTVGRPNEDS